jgi:hypothetical protein
MTSSFDSVPSDHISIADEASLRLSSSGIVTWVLTGTDAIQIGISDDDKDCLTALATVLALGQKFPIFLIANGKATQCT